MRRDMYAFRMSKGMSVVWGDTFYVYCVWQIYSLEFIDYVFRNSFELVTFEPTLRTKSY